MIREVTFRVPASTANLGPGFDALSLAVNRYLKITVSASPTLKIEVHGVDRERIPANEDNLIYRVAQRTSTKRGRTLPTFRMRIDNEIPLARGLGSSAAAIIAGITCYELATGDGLGQQQLLQCAMEYEPHPDNLTAALCGGLIASAAADDGTVLFSKLSIPCKIGVVMVIPSFELPTETARAVLPKTYSRRDAVYNIQRAGLIIAALTTCDWPLIREAMRDRLHHPYRSTLVPGLNEILSLQTDGLLGVALSGAGPSVFALTEPERAEEIGQTMTAIFQNNGVAATPHLVQIDKTGRVIELP